MSETDAKLLRALGDGARTHFVASRMGWDTPRANRALRRLEKEGAVIRDQQRSAVNDIRWLPHPAKDTDDGE